MDPVVQSPAEQAIAQLAPDIQAAVQQYIQQAIETALAQAALAQAAAGGAGAALPPQPQDDLVRQRESILKLAKQAPRFHGKLSEDAIDFVRSLELKWFPAFSITDNAVRAEALAYLLTGRAETWYLGLKERNLVPEVYLVAGQESGLKFTFLQQFNPPDVTGKYRREFEALEQTGAVAVYTDRFRELCLRLSYNLDDWRLRFVDKLKPAVKWVVRMALITSPPMNFEQLALLAKQIDEDQFLLARERRHSNASSWSPPPHPPPPQTPAQHAGHAPGAATPMDLGSIASQDTSSRLTPELRIQLISERKCFYCRQSGHIAVNCPNKKTKPGAVPNGHGQ